MKKVITALTLFAGMAACTTHATPAPGPAMGASATAAGGADATSAVRGFMAAAKLQSIQSLSMWWGDAAGPTRNTMEKDQLEKRELIMLKCLKHDRYDVVGDAPSPGGGRDVVVNMIYRDAESTTHLTVVPGPENRWYVQSVDLTPLHSVCVG